MNQNLTKEKIFSSGLGEFDSDADEISLLELWQIFRRNLKAIIGLAIVAGLVGSQYAFSITPLYLAEASLLVEPDTPKFVSIETLRNTSNISLFYKTQHEIIASRSIANSVVENLKLEQEPFFNSFLVENTSQDEESNLQNWLKWLPGLWEQNDERASPVDDDNESRSKADARIKAIDYIQGNIKVKGVASSQVINVSLESPDPLLSARMVNAVAEAYIKNGLDAQLELNKKAVVWLTDQLTDLRVKLDGSERALRSFKEKEKLIDIASLKSISSGKLGGITEALIKTKADRAKAEIQYKQINEAKRFGRSFESLQAVLNSGLVQRLKEQQIKLNRNMTELSERYGEKHPKIIAAKSDLNDAQRRLDQEMNKVVEGIVRDYEVALSNERELELLSEQLQKEVRSHQSKEFELEKLENDVEKNSQLYDVFLTRFKETSQTGENKLTNIRIMDQALPPRFPSKPNKKRIIALFIILGALFGVGLAFMREFLKNTFMTPEDVEKTLSLPVLGIMPMLEKKDGEENPERHSYMNAASLFIEPLNSIRVSITYANIDDPPKIIMLTSSVPDEGKTTLSSNLALTYSRIGRTLLIDGDFRKQQHTKKVLERRKAKGIAELAAGKINFNEAIFKDAEVDNLYYMGRGTGVPNPLELLSSKRVAALMASLRESFDYIIIDSAPLLPVSDSLVLGNLVDEVIMVIKADDTSHAMAKESLKRLAAAQIRPLGVVLQQVDMKKLHHYDRNYYHYGYDYE